MREVGTNVVVGAAGVNGWLGFLRTMRGCDERLEGPPAAVIRVPSSFSISSAES